MRTTLTIEDDVLAAAKAEAQRQGRMIGGVGSDLARGPLTRPIRQAERNGVPLLPVNHPRAHVTLDVVNELRDEMP